MGIENIYGRNICHGISGKLPAEFYGVGAGKVSLILACLRKLILLIPLIFILPLIFPNKVFAVFLAEPVSDIIAAIVTTMVFMFKFNNILSENE